MASAGFFSACVCLPRVNDDLDGRVSTASPPSPALGGTPGAAPASAPLRAGAPRPQAAAAADVRPAPPQLSPRAHDAHGQAGSGYPASLGGVGSEHLTYSFSRNKEGLELPGGSGIQVSGRSCC
jgi:hypothetical protein